VDASADYIRAAGGVVIREPWDFDDRGRMAVVKDPQGTQFILLTATGGDPEDLLPRLGQWLWSEFITTDAPSAITFYEKLMNYHVEKQELTEGREYLVLKYKHKYRAGIVQAKRQEIKPTWLPYIRVEEPIPVVKRAKELGGKVLLEPTQEIRKGSVAVIEDPTGGIIAVQRWPIDKEPAKR
jgi:predicted enzyme related to lactoylglutathione lyase